MNGSDIIKPSKKVRSMKASGFNHHMTSLQKTIDKITDDTLIDENPDNTETINGSGNKKPTIPSIVERGMNLFYGHGGVKKTEKKKTLSKQTTIGYVSGIFFGD
jgi:hypothetical protein